MGTNVAYAHVKCDPPKSFPQNCAPYVIKVALSNDKWEDQPFVTITRIPQEPCKENVSLFWEVIESVLEFEKLRKGPIKSKDQLVEALATHPELWLKEEMEKHLNRDDFEKLCWILRPDVSSSLLFSSQRIVSVEP
jgi:hypothetical protein